MHSAIFVATIPRDKPTWDLFVVNAQRGTKPGPGVQRLGENVWLLNVQASARALGYLVHYAEEQKISYGILPFHDAPKWLPASFDPTPT